jgi:hypothetical protein
MTNLEIEARLRALTAQERKITGEILTLIREAEKRKLYLARGYPSSFEWLVKEFGYSQSAAYRRIQAARLVEEMPEAKGKLEAGTLNLSLLAQAQSAFQKEARRAGNPLPPERKQEILKKVEYCTAEAAQRLIRQELPEIAHGEDSLRTINEKESRLSVVLSNSAVDHLKRTREVLSHARFGATWGELLSHVLEFFLEAKDPLRKMTHRLTDTVQRRVITSTLRAQVLQRAEGRCEYHDTQTNRRCESRYQLEVDHIHPRALGGSNDPANLRALCRAHNQFEAERLLGPR